MDSYIDTLEGDLERFENEISKLNVKTLNYL